MSVQCRIPGGGVQVLDNASDCQASGGKVVGDPQDGGLGSPSSSSGGCFVRNMLTRAFANTLLDLACADSTTQGMVSSLGLEKVRLSKSAADKRVVLTAARKKSLSSGIVRLIVSKLAPTYQTTYDFRDEVLMRSEWGREWVRLYVKHLPDSYAAISGQQTLVQRTTILWLKAYPFAKALVELSRGNRKAKHTVRLNKADVAECLAVIKLYQENSKSPEYRETLEKLMAEISSLGGKSAGEAWETFSQHR